MLTIEALQAIIDRGTDVDAADQQGTTPLIHAITGPAKAADKLRLVRELLNAAANPDLRDREDRSPLDHAVYCAALPLIRALDKHGVLPDSRDRQGRTALMKLNQKGSKVYKVVELLVELGADVNAQCNAGRTPLMYAALAADHEGMGCFALQAAQARVDIMDRDGKTVIELCEAANPKMLRMLHRNLAEQTGAPNRMPDPVRPDKGGFLRPG